jgi:hypothetical protein
MLQNRAGIHFIFVSLPKDRVADSRRLDLGALFGLLQVSDKEQDFLAAVYGRFGQRSSNFKVYLRRTSQHRRHNIYKMHLLIARTKLQPVHECVGNE